MSYIRDGLLAGEALGEEHLLKVVATVGLAVVRLKVVRVEDAVAARVRADEAMGVPLLAQRKDGLKMEKLSKVFIRKTDYC